MRGKNLLLTPKRKALSPHIQNSLNSNIPKRKSDISKYNHRSSLNFPKNSSRTTTYRIVTYNLRSYTSGSSISDNTDKAKELNTPKTEPNYHLHSFRWLATIKNWAKTKLLNKKSNGPLNIGETPTDKLWGASLLLLLTVLLYFIADLLKNKATLNRSLLLNEIYNECKLAITENNRILLESHVAEPQTRLLFYNEKDSIKLKQCLDLNVALDTNMIINRLIQDRLTDLIDSASNWGGLRTGYEKKTIDRAIDLLAQQKRQYYRLLLAKRVNLAIILHKQGQYDEALKVIEEEVEILLPNIEIPHPSVKATNYNPKEKHARYFPENNKSGKDDLTKLKNREFIKNVFINAYNIKGMIIRSLCQQGNTQYTLDNAEDCLKNALAIKSHPAILSNLAFLLNKKSSGIKGTSQEAIETCNTLRRKALEKHKEAAKTKLGDNNDPGIFNGLAFGLYQMQDPSLYEQALGIFDRALELKPYDCDILNNKAEVLIAIADIKMKDKKTILESEQYLLKAGRCLQLAVEHSMELVDTYELLARVANMRGRYKESIECLQLRSANKSVYADQLHWYDLEEEIQSLRTSNLDAISSKREDKSNSGESFCRATDKNKDPCKDVSCFFRLYKDKKNNSTPPLTEETVILEGSMSLK